MLSIVYSISKKIEYRRSWNGQYPPTSNKMPKSMNIKKAASALNQNYKKIKAALSGVEMTFAAVEKNLGRAQFLLKLAENKAATGTPRGLFTAGTMRISPGQVVIVEGDMKNGYEIVARFDKLCDVQKLVKNNMMCASILAAASCAGGGINTIQEEDDIFDHSDVAADQTEAAGGKAARQKYESVSAAKALATRLGMGDDEINVDAI